MVNSENYNITDLFYQVCTDFPDRIAIVDETGEISFTDLKNEVETTIAYLQSKGIQKGDRILVFVGMGQDLYRIVLAIFSMGAVAVFIDEWVNTKRLSMCCKLAKCKAIIAPLKYRIIGCFISEIRSIPVFLNSKKKLQHIKIIHQSTKKNDSALITFTTGSIGIPKAADRTHGFLKAQFDALHPILTGSVNMTMLPIVLLINLGLGITSVIPKFKSSKPKTFNPVRIFQQINKYNVESIIASPFYLLEMARKVENCPTITHLISGGAPVYAGDAQLISKAFQNANFTVVYGSTEAEPISHCDANQIVIKKESFGLFTGIPVETIELKIISNESKPKMTESGLEEICLKNSEIGEIIVSGIAVNKSYIDNPVAISENKIITEQTVWHRTGDSGYLNEKGELFLCGRVAQIITKSDKTFYPFVIENQLKSLPGIQLGTIIQHKEQIYLVIEKNSAFKPESIEKFNFDKISFLEEIPRDPRHHSKIDYSKLKSLLDLH